MWIVECGVWSVECIVCVYVALAIGRGSCISCRERCGGEERRYAVGGEVRWGGEEVR